LNDSEDKKYGIGELNILADTSIGLEHKNSMFPEYELFIREPFGEQKLYVGISSVYDRIQDLKDSKTIISDRKRYVPKEIV